ncbi:ROK family transcriptional regulator [Streptomyces pactum]|uniref:ROK family transcriptional regulator n=2 Tax=Streptomyces pactum TaxID=68249 RepID=A0ABS0NU42_9ACTN|nr:ROK family transcriptional regulator [Streptomyces pactum]
MSFRRWHMVAARRSVACDPRYGDRSSLLWSLYDSPLTRAELCRRTGLGAATVNSAVTGLLREGVVTESAAAPAAGDGRPGLLRITPGHRHVVGVDVARDRVRVELFDLALTPRGKADYPLRSGRQDPGLVVRHVLAGLRTVLEAAAVPRPEVIGLAVATAAGPPPDSSGPAAPAAGPVAARARADGQHASLLRRLLSAGSGLPVFLDERHHALGRAEMWRGAGRGARHAVLARIDTTVEALVLTRGPHPARTGAGSRGSRWGHTTVRPDGRRCRCGARGCLEAYLGAEAVLERYRQARRGRPVRGEDAEAAFAAMITAADASAAARRVVDEATAHLGTGLAHLVAQFNPERVILGGWAGARLGAHRLPALREAVAAEALRRPSARTGIALCRFGADAVPLAPPSSRSNTSSPRVPGGRCP